MSAIASDSEHNGVLNDLRQLTAAPVKLGQLGMKMKRPEANGIQTDIEANQVS
jgi:hypothetical protein